MQGEIAQIAALALHGNHALQGNTASSFWPGNSTFAFCKSVEFVTLDGDGGSTVIHPFAAGPLQWFDRLASAGALGIRLHCHPSARPPGDRMSVGFVGGGPSWLVEVLSSAASDGWQSRWELGDRDDPERRIWTVTYGRVLSGVHRLSDQTGDADSLCERLSETLETIRGFADRHELTGFADAFSIGLEALRSSAPLDLAYHTDMAPREFVGLSAERLLAVAQSAWVFGGMGSWNDLSFEGDEGRLYDRLSDQLFSLLGEAVVTGVNASCRAMPSA